MVGILKIELPDNFEKGDCENCDLGILCRDRHDIDEYHMGCVLGKEDNCPLEIEYEHYEEFHVNCRICKYTKRCQEWSGSDTCRFEPIGE